MTKTILALYNSHEEASAAVEELVNAGFDRNDVGVAARDWETDDTPVRRMDADVSNQEGAALGAVTGGLAGLALGLTAVLVPGIGTIVAAGPLTVLLGGAAAGAAVGALTGGAVAALVNIGVPQEHAEYYAEAIRRGSSLVSATIKDESRLNEAETILRRHHPFNLERRVLEWKTSGWSGFDASAEPYTAPDQVNVRGELPDEDEAVVYTYPAKPS